MKKHKKKALVAFSGGLDTSFCVVYLQENYEVHTVFVNTGCFSETQTATIRAKAMKLGSLSHHTLDVSTEYFSKGLKFLLFGNVLKNDTYPLSVSSERVFQATAIAQLAQEINADCIVHGSTGAGNDQVRFDLVFRALVTHIEIITPIRDMQLSRQQEIDFLLEKGHFIDAEKAQYSVNEGLWGTSVGGAETLTSHLPLPETAWPYSVTKFDAQEVCIQFEKGVPVALNGEAMDPVTLIRTLDAWAQPFGIGRDMHVGDTIVGIKGRVAFVAAAPLILIRAHQLLEKHTLTKWQQLLKKPQADWYGQLFHEGQFLDPVMRDLEAFLAQCQQRVSGEVYVTLLPYRFELNGITSPFDLMNSNVAAYGEGTKAWTSDDAKGFIKITGMQQQLWHAQQEQLV